MFLKFFFTFVFVAVGLFAGPATSVLAAQSDVVVDDIISNASPANKAMVAEAGKLIITSIQFMGSDDIDRAIGYATVALDIARAAGDKEFVAHAEKLLFAMRAINLVLTAHSLKQQGAAVPEMWTLACKMTRETSRELQGMVKKYIGRSCSPI